MCVLLNCKVCASSTCCPNKPPRLRGHHLKSSPKCWSRGKQKAYNCDICVIYIVCYENHSCFPILTFHYKNDVVFNHYSSDCCSKKRLLQFNIVFHVFLSKTTKTLFHSFFFHANDFFHLIYFECSMIY